MTGTRILAVRLGLLETIRGHENALRSESGVEPVVALGYPYNDVEREKIWTQRARFTQEVASLRPGYTPRSETGRFELCVEVEGIGESQKWTTTRACALGEILEDLIASHDDWPVVEGLNSLTVTGDGQLDEGFNDQGTIARLTLPVRYQARITTEEA